jgi:hypothetical protein
MISRSRVRPIAIRTRVYDEGVIDRVDSILFEEEGALNGIEDISVSRDKSDRGVS